MAAMVWPAWLFTFMSNQPDSLLNDLKNSPIGGKMVCSDYKPVKSNNDEKAFATRCAVCNKLSAMKCGSCKAINYCSKECQKSDWHLHKIICNEYVKFTSSTPRPADTSEVIYKLALLFPEFSTQPTFLWIDIKKSPHAPNRSFCVPNVSSLDNGNKQFTPDVVSITQRFLQQKDSRNFQLHHEVHLYCRDEYMHDGSKNNQSIWAIIKRFYSKEWKGPFFFMGGKSVMCNLHHDPYEFFDFQLADLRQVVSHFKTAGSIMKR